MHKIHVNAVSSGGGLFDNDPHFKRMWSRKRVADERFNLNKW